MTSNRPSPAVRPCLRVVGDARTRPGAIERAGSDAVGDVTPPEALLLGAPPPLPPALLRLTPREHQVLTEIGLGKADKEIAGALGLTPATVGRYVRRVLHKLGVRNRTEACRLALLGAGAEPGRAGGSTSCGRRAG